MNAKVIQKSLKPGLDCNLNVHQSCQEMVPPMCGADISEVRGKLLLYVELKGNNLKVDSKWFHFIIAAYVKY